jgi:DNA-directed RNA polymerase subunit beta
VLVGFMSFDGYNFEDAIIISEELVRNDTYTSIHIEEFDVEIRETKLGREEFTRDIPNVSEKALRNLDENGIVRSARTSVRETSWSARFRRRARPS